MLQVIRTEVVPEIKIIKGEESIPSMTLMRVLDNSVTEICQSTTISDELSPKLGFCWGIILTICRKIPVKADNLRWAHDYIHLINRLFFIHRNYCRKHGELASNISVHEDMKMCVN